MSGRMRCREQHRSQLGRGIFLPQAYVASCEACKRSLNVRASRCFAVQAAVAASNMQFHGEQHHWQERAVHTRVIRLQAQQLCLQMVIEPVGVATVLLAVSSGVV